MYESKLKKEIKKKVIVEVIDLFFIKFVQGEKISNCKYVEVFMEVFVN